MRMSIHKKLVVGLCAGCFVAALTGCEREGPMERAGEKIDEAVQGEHKGSMERMGEKMDNAAKETGKAVEEAGEKMQEQATH